MPTATPIARALLSVSDKAGIVDFARDLAALGVALVSTGGTFKTLKDAGLAVTEVADLTGFPEMMDGRVKTLHPKVHGGLLAIRGNAEHEAAAKTHGIAADRSPGGEPLSLRGDDRARRRLGTTRIENIDIGGPAMIRAASKNHEAVTVVVDHCRLCRRHRRR